MARKRNTDASHKPIEQYDHKDKDRLNNPPVGLVDAHTDNGGQKRKTYQYDPHLDPQLQWAGKAEHTSFEVPTVSLHVHERIDPRRIIKTVQKVDNFPRQLSLFEGHKKPLREAVEFYKHKENWSNRLVAGDSLLVMNSLLEKEGMGGKLIEFTRVEAARGLRYVQAEAETKEDKPKKVYVVFGPEHAPLEQRMVELAWEEAKPYKPDILLFCALQFDEEAAKDIDEMNPEITKTLFLKAQMNADLLTEDLKKKRSSNESFWLIGQPDVKVMSG